MGERINKLCYDRTMDCYTAIKKNKTFYDIHSYINECQKDYCRIAFLCNSIQDKTNL